MSKKKGTNSREIEMVNLEELKLKQQVLLSMLSLPEFSDKDIIKIKELLKNFDDEATKREVFNIALQRKDLNLLDAINDVYPSATYEATIRNKLYDILLQNDDPQKLTTEQFKLMQKHKIIERNDMKNITITVPPLLYYVQKYKEAQSQDEKNKIFKIISGTFQDFQNPTNDKKYKRKFSGSINPYDESLSTSGKKESPYALAEREGLTDITKLMDQYFPDKLNSKELAAKKAVENYLGNNDRGKNFAVFKQYLANGGNPNLIFDSKTGNTLLHEAVTREDEDLTKLLKDNDQTNFRIQNKEGLTTLEIVKRKNEQAEQRMLQEDKQRQGAEKMFSSFNYIAQRAMFNRLKAQMEKTREVKLKNAVAANNAIEKLEASKTAPLMITEAGEGYERKREQYLEDMFQAIQRDEQERAKFTNYIDRFTNNNNNNNNEYELDNNNNNKPKDPFSLRREGLRLYASQPENKLSLETLNMILSAGANPYYKGDDKESAFELALKNKNLNMIRAFDASFSTDQSKAAIAQLEKEYQKELVEIVSKPPLEKTLGNIKEIVKRERRILDILDKGVNSEAAFQAAFENGNFHLIELMHKKLLDEGKESEWVKAYEAHINKMELINEDFKGYQELEQLFNLPEEELLGNKDRLKELLDSGIDPYKKFYNRKSAFDLAKENGNTGFMMLVNHYKPTKESKTELENIAHKTAAIAGRMAAKHRESNPSVFEQNEKRDKNRMHGTNAEYLVDEEIKYREKINARRESDLMREEDRSSKMRERLDNSSNTQAPKVTSAEMVKYEALMAARAKKEAVIAAEKERIAKEKLEATAQKAREQEEKKKQALEKAKARLEQEKARLEEEKQERIRKKTEILKQAEAIAQKKKDKTSEAEANKKMGNEDKRSRQVESIIKKQEEEEQNRINDERFSIDTDSLYTVNNMDEGSPKSVTKIPFLDAVNVAGKGLAANGVEVGSSNKPLTKVQQMAQKINKGKVTSL